MSSVNLLTDWRVDVKAALKVSFPTARVYDGERPAAQLARDATIICVFSGGMTAWGQDVLMAQPTMTIRLWCAQPLSSVEFPADPQPVEQAVIDLANCLKPLQVTTDGPDYFQVREIRADYQEYGCEALLVGWTRSPMEGGG